MESAQPLFVEMVKVGKVIIQLRLTALVACALYVESRTICPFEFGTTLTTFSPLNNEHEESCEGRLPRMVLWGGRCENSSV
jgi:hypothetical protein